MTRLLAEVDIGKNFILKENKGITDVFENLGSLISTLLPNVYVIAGVMLFVLLIFGGFTYILSSGQQKPEGVQQGKNAIFTALIGFVLIFASWWIVQIIERITGLNILKPEF